MMDPRPGHLTNYSSPLWGVGFRQLISGLLTEMRRKSPVQQWVDSLPTSEEPAGPSSPQVLDESTGSLSLPVKKLSLESDGSPVPKSLRRDDSIHTNDICDATTPIDDDPQIDNSETKDSVKFDSADKLLLKRSSKSVLLRERSTNSEGNSPKYRHPFFRDSSLQSEGGTSRCSSVESLLESRRVDAEAVLRGVGFGPSPARQQLARIPDRFLRPSKVKGVNTDQFIKDEQKSMKMHECGVFGYRGLTGHPHVPPSTIVAKIIERISSQEELPEPPYFLQTTRQSSDIDTF